LIVLEKQNNYSFLNLPEISRKNNLQKKSSDYCFKNLNFIFTKRVEKRNRKGNVKLRRIKVPKSNLLTFRFLFLEERYTPKKAFIDFRKTNRIKKKFKVSFILIARNTRSKREGSEIPISTCLFFKNKGGFVVPYFGIPGFVPRSRARCLEWKESRIKGKILKTFELNTKMFGVKKRFSNKRRILLKPISKLAYQKPETRKKNKNKKKIRFKPINQNAPLPL
jgi:hypothetical protein